MLQRDGEWIPERCEEHEAHLNVMPPTPGFQRDLSTQKCMQIPGTFKENKRLHSERDGLDTAKRVWVWMRP